MVPKERADMDVGRAAADDMRQAVGERHDQQIADRSGQKRRTSKRRCPNSFVHREAQDKGTQPDRYAGSHADVGDAVIQQQAAGVIEQAE